MSLYQTRVTYFILQMINVIGKLIKYINSWAICSHQISKVNLTPQCVRHTPTRYIQTWSYPGFRESKNYRLEQDHRQLAIQFFV